MAVAIVDDYRVHAGDHAAFLGAVRSTFEQAEHLGARATLRHTVIGGEFAGVRSAFLVFPDAEARAAYLDARAADALADIEASGASLLGSAFLDEVPATSAIPEQPPVLAAIRFRPTPGRERETDEALRLGAELRGGLGIEARVWVAQYAGGATGLRFLAIHAASHQQLTEDAARVVANRQRLGGLGPIPLAIEAGAMTMVGSTISTLVTL